MVPVCPVVVAVNQPKKTVPRKRPLVAGWKKTSAAHEPPGGRGTLQLGGGRMPNSTGNASLDVLAPLTFTSTLLVLVKVTVTNALGRGVTGTFPKLIFVFHAGMVRMRRVVQRSAAHRLSAHLPPIPEWSSVGFADGWWPHSLVSPTLLRSWGGTARGRL